MLVSYLNPKWKKNNFFFSFSSSFHSFRLSKLFIWIFRYHFPLLSSLFIPVMLMMIALMPVYELHTFYISINTECCKQSGLLGALIISNWKHPQMRNISFYFRGKTKRIEMACISLCHFIKWENFSFILQFFTYFKMFWNWVCGNYIKGVSESGSLHKFMWFDEFSLFCVLNAKFNELGWMTGHIFTLTGHSPKNSKFPGCLDL